MRRVFGPRNVVEVAFLVAVPVVALVLGKSRATIIAAAAVAYLLVLVVEVTLWRDGAPLRERIRSARAARTPKAGVPAAPARPVIATAPAPAPEERLASEHVRVLRREPRPEPAPVPVPQSDPEPEPEPELEPQPELELELELEPEPEPVVVVERPPLAAVPEPEPEPAPPAAFEPSPVSSVVVPIGVGAGPQRWNVWDLERLSRERSGGDALRDEERTFLLMYLREFAGPDGLLPIDFDGLVRDSFGDLVARP